MVAKEKGGKSAFILGKAHFSFSVVLLFIVNVSFHCLFSYHANNGFQEALDVALLGEYLSNEHEALRSLSDST